jgi:hypothetical protein
MNGGDVNDLFPVNHKEKFLRLEDVEEFDEDWNSRSWIIWRDFLLVEKDN